MRKRRPPAHAGGAQPLLWCGYYHHAIPEVFRAPAAHYTGRPALRQTVANLPRRPAAAAGRPTYRHLARFGARCPHTHSRQAARPCDFAALNLAGLCAVVPYEHELAWAGDSTFIPKSGRRLPGVGWRWHSGEGRVAWGQQYELLSVLDLKEHCYLASRTYDDASASYSKLHDERQRRRNEQEILDDFIRDIREVDGGSIL